MGRSTLVFLVAIGAVALLLGQAVSANPLGVSDDEYNGLVAIYDSMDGPNWTNSTNWLTDNPDWYGVTIEDGRVTRLELPNNHLFGSLPMMTGGLRYLTLVNLDNNTIVEVPQSFGNLTSLTTLSFAGCSIYELPNQMLSLVSLRSLNLSGNNLGLNTVSNLDMFYYMTELEELRIANNWLTSLPSSVRLLSKLRVLDARNNNISGGIPWWFGDLSDLETLMLDSNPLGGSLGSLAGLSKLTTLSLSSDGVYGNLPDWLLQLPSLRTLNLARNYLEGPLPSDIGSATQLTSLLLNGNAFIGEIPPSITNLTNTSLCVDANCLSSSDPAVRSFLATKDSTWYLDQTIPPTDPYVTPGSWWAVVHWTPITYKQCGGRYEVGWSYTAGGPYMFDPSRYKTSSLNDSELGIFDLDLSKPIYFVVRTVSPGTGGSPTWRTSLSSAEAALMLPVGDKRDMDGAQVTLRDMAVSAILISEYDIPRFYIEKADRSFGVCIENDYGFSLGDRFDASGQLYTNADGERGLYLSGWVPLGSTTIAPLCLTNRALGGGNWRYDAKTGAGQMGVTGGIGLNNIGLLVRITGTCTGVDEYTFTVNDGSGASVRCELPLWGEWMVNPAWRYVTVTGVSSILLDGTSHVRRLRVIQVQP